MHAWLWRMGDDGWMEEQRTNVRRGFVTGGEETGHRLWLARLRWAALLRLGR